MILTPLQVGAALPAVLRLLDTPDGELLVDVCWALTDLCEKTHAPLAARIGVCHPLVTLLAHPSPGIVTPALLAEGLLLAAALGLLGALWPAWRAARLPIATALRES